MSENQNTTQTEIWKAIPGFPGYEVSDQGRVRSYRRNGPGNTITAFPRKILKAVPDADGYPRVCLRQTQGGKPISKKTATLVLEVFVGPRPPRMEGCHNDGKPGNNFLINLRWDTPKNNHADKRRHGTARYTYVKGELHPRAKLNNGHILAIRYLKSIGFNYKTLASMYKTCRGNISLIVTGKTWNHI